MFPRAKYLKVNATSHSLEHTQTMLIQKVLEALGEEDGEVLAALWCPEPIVAGAAGSLPDDGQFNLCQAVFSCMSSKPGNN